LLTFHSSLLVFSGVAETVVADAVLEFIFVGPAVTVVSVITIAFYPCPMKVRAVLWFDVVFDPVPTFLGVPYIVAHVRQWRRFFYFLRVSMMLGVGDREGAVEREVRYLHD
jgi:hypothetical protein